MSKVEPESCPKCHSSNIGVKDHYVKLGDGRFGHRVCAFCYRCAYHGPETICQSNNDDDITDAAYTIWNTKLHTK